MPLIAKRNLNDPTSYDAGEISQEEYDTSTNTLQTTNGSAGRAGSLLVQLRTMVRPVGSVVPIVGTFIGGLVGGIVGGVAGAEFGDDLGTKVAGAEWTQGRITTTP